MKRITAILLAMLVLFSLNVASAEQRFMMYIDAVGTIDYNSKDMSDLVNQIQAKMQPGTLLLTTPVAASDLESLRLSKQQELEDRLARYPGYEALSTGRRALLSDNLLLDFMAPKNIDGMVILRLNPISANRSINILNTVLLGLGTGKDTEIDMQVTLIVYTKAQRTVFLNTQVVKTKVSGAWAPVAASKRALPKALENIDIIRTMK